MGIFHVEHKTDIGQLLLAIAVIHMMQKRDVKGPISGSPAAVMQRTIHLLSALLVMISAYSSSDSSAQLGQMAGGDDPAVVNVVVIH